MGRRWCGGGGMKGEEDELLPMEGAGGRPESGPVATVLLDGPGDLQFDYLVPEGLVEGLGPGSRVLCPLQQRRQPGTVLAVHEEAPEAGRRLKALISRYDERPALPGDLLRLARWVSEYYCAPLETVVRAMLPGSVRTDRHAVKTRRMVELVRVPGEEEMAVMTRRAPRQAEAVKALGEMGGRGPAAEHGAAVVKALVAAGWVVVSEEEVERDPHAGDTFVATQPLELNEGQRESLEAILEAVAKPGEAKPVLLHGVTGSGKTEVYLQAAQAVLDAGKSVLVLVPEISLTPQTVDRFKSRFATMTERIAVLHSHMSQGERFDEWQKIRRGRARIVIGARSAVFAPLTDLGLILVDEEHENSYKQESPPRYQARDVAVVRAAQTPCAIVLGSATPALESWYNAQRGKYRLLTMGERADSAGLPLIRVIDMRLEKRRAGPKGTPPIISERLRLAMDQRLQRAEQTILFINRRGFAASVQCLACGHVVKCAHCSVPMTLHHESQRLVCHVCGFQKLPPKKCPECADPGILLAGYGTERVHHTLTTVFPKARTARVDTDAMQQKHTLRDTLQQFKTGKIDILVGTQMIAKGLHFPNVTLVGVLNADLTLHTPDFRAAERTFSLLTQVAGRAGRGSLRGEVIVQTYSPHLPAILHARHHDFTGFSEQELEMRKVFSYPPYTHAALLTCKSPNQRMAEFTLETLHRRIVENAPEGLVVGDPAPSPLEKSHDQYRFQILLRAPRTSVITRHVQPILKGTTFPQEVVAVFDVDPVSLS